MVPRFERHRSNKEDLGTPSRPCSVSNLDQDGPPLLLELRRDPRGIKDSTAVRRSLLEIRRTWVRDLPTPVDRKLVPNALAVINVAPVVLKVSWNFYVHDLYVDDNAETRRVTGQTSRIHLHKLLDASKRDAVKIHGE